LVGAKIKLPRINVEDDAKFKVDKQTVESKMSDRRAEDLLKKSLEDKLKERQNG